MTWEEIFCIQVSIGFCVISFGIFGSISSHFVHQFGFYSVFSLFWNEFIVLKFVKFQTWPSIVHLFRDFWLVETDPCSFLCHRCLYCVYRYGLYHHLKTHWSNFTIWHFVGHTSLPTSKLKKTKSVAIIAWYCVKPRLSVS